MYKMVQISKKEHEKCEVETIYKGRYFWVDRKDLEVESDVAKWAQIFDKCDTEKQKYRHELMPNTEFQQDRRFVRNAQLKEKLKAVENHQKRFQNLKKLGLDPDVVTCDEQDIISALQVAFEREIILTQYCIENKTLDAYFSKYQLGIEVDEYNHEGRSFEYEQSRQFIMESY